MTKRTFYCLVAMYKNSVVVELGGDVSLPIREYDSLDDIGSCVTKLEDEFKTHNLILTDLELVNSITRRVGEDEEHEMNILVPILYDLRTNQRFAESPTFVLSAEDREIVEIARSSFLADMPYIKFRRKLAEAGLNYCVFFGLNAVSVRRGTNTLKYFFDPSTGNMELIRIIWPDFSRKEINLKTKKTRTLKPDVLMKIRMETKQEEIREEEFD